MVVVIINLVKGVVTAPIFLCLQVRYVSFWLWAVEVVNRGFLFMSRGLQTPLKKRSTGCINL